VQQKLTLSVLSHVILFSNVSSNSFQRQKKKQHFLKMKKRQILKHFYLSSDTFGFIENNFIFHLDSFRHHPYSSFSALP
jgi:hypothetical protein